ncbi:phage tail tape measure protein, partial [Staphylococcus aureus]
KELESATESFLKFSHITGSDGVQAVQLITRAMGDAGIEADEYQSVLDMVAKAAQASGISVDTLADSITKYGAPMRAMGFEMKESIALFSQWEKSGVNTEIAFSGLKKAISNWGKA